MADLKFPNMHCISIKSNHAVWSKHFCGGDISDYVNQENFCLKRNSLFSGDAQKRATMILAKSFVSSLTKPQIIIKKCLRTIKAWQELIYLISKHFSQEQLDWFLRAICVFEFETRHRFGGV